MNELVTVPFGVTYSSTEDGICVCFELQEHHDSEQCSLFAEFLTYAVDALNGHNTDKFFELLEPSPKQWDEIRQSNQRRGTWGHDDKETFSRIRKKCSDFGDFISIHTASQERITSVDVTIGDKIDPTGNL